MELFVNVGRFGRGRIGMAGKAADDHAKACGPCVLCDEARELAAACDDAYVLCHGNS